jgi:hypothetical protein
MAVDWMHGWKKYLDKILSIYFLTILTSIQVAGWKYFQRN